MKVEEAILGWDEQKSFEDKRQEGLYRQSDKLGEKIGRNPDFIYNRLSLLHLPESLQTA